jgi:hypothetical protein
MPRGIDAIVIETGIDDFKLYYNSKSLHICESVKMMDFAGGGYKGDIK